MRLTHRANCWDNVPQESFCGQMNGEIQLQNRIISNDIFAEIEKLIYYYNYESYSSDVDYLVILDS